MGEGGEVMRPTLPDWLREQASELVAGYIETARLCEQRYRELTSRHTSRYTEPADDYGTADDYRMDAKYATGQVGRMREMLRGHLTPAEYAEGPWQEIPSDPRKLARWAFVPPWSAEPTLEPLEAMRVAKPHDLMEKFTEREAEALILCEGLGMRSDQAAPIMGCSAAKVRDYLCNARRKFGPNEP
jgi:DNA-binding CsgD family transcriptional regulator